MRSSLETREGIADMLNDLFRYAGVSVRDVASRLGVTEKTVRHWLDAESEPNPSTMFRLFRVLNVPSQPFLRDRGTTTQAEDHRQAVLRYINTEASAEELRDMAFNLTVKHGSSVRSQLALVSILNHMKLRYRLIAAKLILNLWDLAGAEGGRQYMNDSQPNVARVLDATIATHQAVKDGKDSYTDI